MRGEIELVRSDAEQPWHVRLAAHSAEPLSASEQLARERTAMENVLAQARTFGYDTPHITTPAEGAMLLWSGLSISGHALAHEFCIAEIRVVDERTA